MLENNLYLYIYLLLMMASAIGIVFSSFSTDVLFGIVIDVLVAQAFILVILLEIEEKIEKE